jgi:hypothetical protein
MQADFSIAGCTVEERATFATKLAKWSEMTWQQLTQADRHGLGYEHIKSILVPRPPHVPEDASLLAFRFHSHLPVIGYRTERVFHAVWFDRNPTGVVYRH